MTATSAFIAHLPVLQSCLFAFFTLPDVVRLLATCRELRDDTETADAILNNFPVAHFIMQCSSISFLGCTPFCSPRPVHRESWASTLSLAGCWEKHIVPSCYQWQPRRRISTRIEPFLLPLPDPCVDNTSQAIDAVLRHHGVDASADNLESNLKTLEVGFLYNDSDNSTDSESDWDSSDSDCDSDCSDSEEDVDPMLLKCLRPLQQCITDTSLRSVHRLRIGVQHDGDLRRLRETRDLFVGLNSSGTVLAGVLVRTKAAGELS